MKKLIVTLIMGLMAVMPSDAQVYRGPRYGYRPVPPRISRRYYPSYRMFSYRDNPASTMNYIGLRVGPTFSTVNSDDAFLDAGDCKTGLNVGLAAGFGLTYRAPIFFETGLYYTSKGGKNDYYDCTYNLNYIEVPLVLKYVANIDRTFSVQPFFGGYLACGVGGKVKDYKDYKAFSSFDDAFNRFDGGLRMGVGMGIDMLYVDLTYDLGLTNIGKDEFDDCHTSSFMINVGLNF